MAKLYYKRTKDLIENLFNSISLFAHLMNSVALNAEELWITEYIKNDCIDLICGLDGISQKYINEEYDKVHDSIRVSQFYRFTKDQKVKTFLFIKWGAKCNFDITSLKTNLTGFNG